MVQFRLNMDLRDDVIQLIKAGLVVVWCTAVLAQVNALYWMLLVQFCILELLPAQKD